MLLYAAKIMGENPLKMLILLDLHPDSGPFLGESNKGRPVAKDLDSFWIEFGCLKITARVFFLGLEHS